jgi:septum site-determining protein MinD
MSAASGDDQDKRQPELFLIPAAQTRDKTAVSPSDMIRLCDDLRSDFDRILIDSPAGIERGFRNSIAPADKVIVITNPEVSAVRDADRIIGLIEAEEKGPAQLVINRIKADMIRRGEMLAIDDVLELLAVELLGIIPDDEQVLLAGNRGVPIAIDSKGPAGLAFRNIARRIKGEFVPFIDLNPQKGLIGKISQLLRPGGN